MYFFFRLNTDRNLYNSLQHVIKNGDIESTTDIDNHVAGLFSADFEQSGIHLQEEQRQEVVNLNDFILQVITILKLNIYSFVYLILFLKIDALAFLYQKNLIQKRY